MELFEERLQFLNDMVFYYGTNPARRAMVDQGYSSKRKGVYFTWEGKCCAIGRFIHKNKRSIHLSGSVKNIFLYNPDNNTQSCVMLEDLIPAKIYALGVDFLSVVSNLHDVDSFWYNLGGLTLSGQEQYNHIIEIYCSPEIHIDYEERYIR